MPEWGITGLENVHQAVILTSVRYTASHWLLLNFFFFFFSSQTTTPQDMSFNKMGLSWQLDFLRMGLKLCWWPSSCERRTGRSVSRVFALLALSRLLLRGSWRPLEWSGVGGCGGCSLIREWSAVVKLQAWECLLPLPCSNGTQGRHYQVRGGRCQGGFH